MDAPAQAQVARVDGAPRRRLRLSDHLFISVYWFALNFHWMPMLSVIVSTHILTLVPEYEKARVLGYVMAMGAFVAMIVQPLAGAASDRCTHSLGRRRPFVVAGTLGNCLALMAMAYAPGLWPFAIAFFFVQMMNNISGGAYQGLIPDLVPEEERGKASGFMGLMTMLGSIVSIVICGVMVEAGLLVHTYWLIAGVLIAGMLLTLYGVRERPLETTPPFEWRSFLRQFWVDPRRFPDFAWVWVTRALVMLGFYTLLEFLNYYLRDVLGMTNFVGATAQVSALVLVGATLSTFVSGSLSDRAGRRLLVCVAGLLMGTTALAFLLTDSFGVVLAFGVVFGLGYGAYISVDWALAVDVLPSAGTAGKDLGIWSIAVTLPQVIAPLVGGQIIHYGNQWGPGLGYRAVYLTAFLYIACGAVLVWRIRRAR